MNHHRRRFVAGFLAVPVTLYTVYVLSPCAQALVIALTDWRGVNAVPRFVGVDNFRRLLGDEVFLRAAGHNLLLLALVPPLTIGLALLFAWLLTGDGTARRTVRGAGLYRVVFFFPQVLAVVLVAVLFRQILRPDGNGMLNAPLTALGFAPVGPLADTDLALWAVLFVLVWQAVGFYVVLFSAGIASIPRELFEAAAIDGAGGGRLFLRITLPLLRDTVQAGWVYLGVAALDVFAVVWVMTAEHGGPDHSTTVMAAEVYRNAFHYSRFGYACAMGVVLFVITTGFAVLVLRLTRRERIEFR
ncbi:carbohydrate ABC transporter permease [Streptosporangium saharense]|uniref:N-acetylglucosamine transport system permease protein n=1 Tax=Streptosporangium saharense TaxID=1706840 RepID=A0A7W7QQX3_9ACTN|nr:sugar ABC transporter permease [Streptosporangium saharense]MBB4918141.1 N-acetylglucosamine transport system permease protein [Streptosporangium saharense]